MKFLLSAIFIVYGIAIVCAFPQGLGSFGQQGGAGSQGGGSGDETKDFHHYPKYKFAYGVKDPHTGDLKEAWEHRDGDKVVGEYSLVEPDGTHRIVKYHANDKEGFNAIVEVIGKPKEEIGQLKQGKALHHHEEKHHLPAVSYQKVHHL